MAQRRYRIHAYVRAGDVVRRHSVTSQVTFKWVYQNRPDGCRYAVISDWDNDAHARRYGVLDLFNVLKDPDTNELTPPEPRWRSDSCSAAIMTTVLLYGDAKGGDHAVAQR
jgi:hypothetical protein